MTEAARATRKAMKRAIQYGASTGNAETDATVQKWKLKGKLMPERTRIANARKSRVRSAVEHVFAHQKCLMGLAVRTIGLARARLKIGLANLAYNMRRLVWLRAKYAAA